VSASQRIQELIDRTAGPKVKATVTVDQVYAEIQHEALEFRHPRGGQAKYLEEPMFSHYGGWMQDFANGLLREGSRADEGWADVGRNLKDVSGPMRRSSSEIFASQRLCASKRAGRPSSTNRLGSRV
jgi:hypothetical protein